MITVNIPISGEVEKFILSAMRLYQKSKESVVCDLIAKGYDPEGSVTGADISKADGEDFEIPKASGKPPLSGV